MVASSNVHGVYTFMYKAIIKHCCMHGPMYCMQSHLMIALYMTVYTACTFKEACIALQGSASCFAVTRMHSTTEVNQNKLGKKAKQKLDTLSGEMFPSCNAKSSSIW